MQNIQTQKDVSPQYSNLFIVSDVSDIVMPQYPKLQISK